jgi:hypothetical protein
LENCGCAQIAEHHYLFFIEVFYLVSEAFLFHEIRDISTLYLLHMNYYS